MYTIALGTRHSWSHRISKVGGWTLVGIGAFGIILLILMLVFPFQVGVWISWLILTLTGGLPPAPSN